MEDSRTKRRRHLSLALAGCCGIICCATSVTLAVPPSSWVGSPIESFVLPTQSVTRESGVPFKQSIETDRVNRLREQQARQRRELQAENDYRLRSLTGSTGPNAGSGAIVGSGAIMSAGTARSDQRVQDRVPDWRVHQPSLQSPRKKASVGFGLPSRAAPSRAPVLHALPNSIQESRADSGSKELDPPAAQFFTLPQQTSHSIPRPFPGRPSSIDTNTKAQATDLRGSFADSNVSDVFASSPLNMGTTDSGWNDRLQALSRSTLTSRLHAAQLHTLANQSIESAADALRRRSVYAAQKSAYDALHAIVAARDAEQDTNVHTERLHAALDAVREAEDFCGRFGAVDHNAVKRMIESHSTPVLRNQDLSRISAIKAVETYLAVGKNNLVAAVGHSHDASEALRLLGRVEQQLGDKHSIYPQAVAMTWLQAAVQVRPENAVAHRDLGRTLLSQGLPHQAAELLQRSVELTPTRGAWEDLLTASRQTGDLEAVARCRASLEDPSLPSDFPFVRLSPQQFAQTSQRQSVPSANVPGSGNASDRSNDAQQDSDRVALAPGGESDRERNESREGVPWYRFWRR